MSKETLEPIQEMHVTEVMALKEQLATYLVNRAIAQDGGTAADYCVREVVLGDDSADASLGNGWIDLGIKTEATDNSQAWLQDAGDLTADDLSNVLTANYEINSHNWLGFYGIADLCPQPAYLKGTTTGQIAPVGALAGIRFQTTSSFTKAYWHTEKLYGYSNPVGICRTPITYDAETKIAIQMQFTEATLDKQVALRGLLCEPWIRVNKGQFRKPDIVPDLSSTDFGRMWIDPFAELTIDEINRRKQNAADAALNLAIKVDGGSKEDYIIRDWVAGDESDATDFVDNDFKTASITGLEHWAQDAGDLTANQPSSIFASNDAVNKGKYLAVYGFLDRSPNPDLYAIHLLRGAQRIGAWHVEHCYGRGPAGGLANEPILYQENDIVDVQMTFKDATIDRNVVMLGYMIERPDINVSQSSYA